MGRVLIEPGFTAGFVSPVGEEHTGSLSLYTYWNVTKMSSSFEGRKKKKLFFPFFFFFGVFWLFVLFDGWRIRREKFPPPFFALGLY